MDDADFRALIGDLSLTADIRLSDLANRDYHTFRLLWTKMLEIMAERNELERVDLDVSNARERSSTGCLGAASTVSGWCPVAKIVSARPCKRPVPLSPPFFAGNQY
jgi:hypothetical protein